MHEIYIIMQMYALELGSYGIIKLLTNTGFFFLEFVFMMQ